MRARVEKDALKYLALGDYDRAIEEYKKIIREGIENPEIFNSLGDAYLRKGDVPNALSNYWKALEKFEADGLPENAYALAKKIARYENSKRVYIKLAELSSLLGYHDEAVDYLNRCLDMGLGRDEIDRVMNSFKKVASEISKDMINEPRFERLFLRLQEIVEGFGDLSLAHGIGSEVLEEKTLDQIQEEEKKKTEEKKKAKEEARKRTPRPVQRKEEAPQKAPDKEINTKSRAHLISLLMSIKENLGASDSQGFEELLEEGKELFDMGLHEAAISSFQKALSIKETPAAYALLGRAFLERGEAELALMAFERGLGLAKDVSDQVVLNYWKGLAHEKRGEVKESLEALRRAYLLDRDFGEIREKMEEISGKQRRRS